MEKIKQLIIKYQRFITFGFIGGINTILSQLLYMVFIKFNLMNVSIASIVADCLTMVVSYVLNMKLTYKQPLSIKSAISYPIAYIPGTLVTSLITTLVTYYGIPKIWAKAFTLPISIPLNYFLVSLTVKLTGKKNNKDDEVDNG